MKTIPEDLLRQIREFNRKYIFIVTDNLQEAEIINRATNHNIIIVEANDDIYQFVDGYKQYYNNLSGGMDCHIAFIFIRELNIITKNQLLSNNYDSISNKMRFLPRTKVNQYKTFIEMEKEEGKNAVYMAFLIQNNPLIKPDYIYLFNCIKKNKIHLNKDYNNNDFLSEWKNLQKTLERNNKDSNYSWNENFTNWVSENKLMETEEDKNYFEYDFLWSYYSFLKSDEFSIERPKVIKDNNGEKIQNPDFLIEKNGCKSLIELTRFELELDSKKEQFIEINKDALAYLKYALRLTTGFFPRFIKPWHVTKMLGYENVLKKIKDKITQCNAYANYKVQHDYKKFIFLDLSQWIADSNIRTNNTLWVGFLNSLDALKENEKISGFLESNIVENLDHAPKVNRSYKKGIYYDRKYYEDMKKINSVICKLQKTLCENDINLVVTFDSFNSFLNDGCLVMFTGNSIEWVNKNNFEKLFLRNEGNIENN